MELALARAAREAAREAREAAGTATNGARTVGAAARGTRAAGTTAPGARAAGASRGGLAGVAGALAAAAAVVLGVSLAERLDTGADRALAPAGQAHVAARPRTLPIALPADGAARPGVVVALAGRPTVDGRVAELDAEVAEGARIETDVVARLDVRLADGTGFTVGRETALVATRLRENATVLALDHGEIGQQVAPLGADQRWLVLAGAYAVRVRGTQFFIVRRGDDLTVAVREGRVEVLRDGEVVATVGPGERWSSAGDLPRQLIGPPLGLEPGALRWPVLRLPPTAHVTAWEFPFASLPPSGVAMRHAPGTLEAIALRGPGRATRLTLTLEELGLAPDSERALRGVVDPQAQPAEPPRTPSLDAAAVRQVVAAGMDGLGRCYRTGLMRRPDLEGRMTLQLAVDARGRVSRARLSMGATPLPWLAQCVEAQAQGWAFPVPSPPGNVPLTVPLDFAQR
jgi:ferric-dicitrate binding protein FerR (iron transport regulator)